MLDPPPDEKVYAWLRGAFVVMLGDFFGDRPRVRVEIVATDSGETLVEWMERSEAAGLLKAKIESDLNKMDAEAFASEWGLTTPPSERDLE